MSAPEFKAGDKVRTASLDDEVCTVALPTDGNGMIVLRRANGNYWCCGPEDLSFDVVRVMVEFTTDEADEIVRDWAIESSAAVDKIRVAIREARL